MKAPNARIHKRTSSRETLRYVHAGQNAKKKLSYQPTRPPLNWLKICIFFKNLNLFSFNCFAPQLVSGEMLLTCAEKERLDELLRQIDEEEEEEDNTKDTDSEVGWREALTENTCCRMRLYFIFFNTHISCVEDLWESTSAADDQIQCSCYQHLKFTFNKRWVFKLISYISCVSKV